MAWMEPKTNWVETDYFNAEDYNRIIGNLVYLKEFSEGLHDSFELLDMGTEKTYSDFIYAREMNVIESNLETINSKTCGFDIGVKVVYSDNGNTPTFTELNRIESAMLKLYETMKSHRDNLPKLAFRIFKKESEV